MTFNIYQASRGRKGVFTAITGVSALVVALAACSGESISPTPVTSADAASALDAAQNTDASGDSGAGSTDRPVVLAIAPGRHARLFNVAYTNAGIFGIGQVGEANDDMAFLLVKILPTGVLDTTFGTGGVVSTNIVVGGGNGELARGVVVQPDGKIVVAGAVEHGAAADPTRDIAVVRYNANGGLDSSFGTAGVQRFVLSNGEAVQQWGLNLLSNGNFLVTGARKADGVATNEFVVFRLLGSNGAIDTTFASTDGGGDGGTGGVFKLGFATNISPRNASVLADGSILVAGYTNAGGNKPIVFKLSSNGVIDNTFGTGGVYFPETGIAGFGSGGTAEAYGAALQGNQLVTVGYGKQTDTQPALGWISLRLTTAGALDSTFGTSGHAWLPVNGQNANARALTILDDNRIVLVGGASPPKPSPGAGTQSQYAAVAILTPDGALDTSFSDAGPRMFDMGGPATGRAAHFFWGAAPSPAHDTLAIVGIKGAISANAEAGVVGGKDEAIFYMVPTSH